MDILEVFFYVMGILFVVGIFIPKKTSSRPGDNGVAPTQGDSEDFGSSFGKLVDAVQSGKDLDKISQKQKSIDRKLKLLAFDTEQYLDKWNYFEKEFSSETEKYFVVKKMQDALDSLISKYELGKEIDSICNLSISTNSEVIKTSYEIAIGTAESSRLLYENEIARMKSLIDCAENSYNTNEEVKSVAIRKILPTTNLSTEIHFEQKKSKWN